MKVCGGADYVGYQATVFVDKKLIKSLPISSDDRILDIGCGKGKMVFYFDRLGFGKSDGIEYLQDMAEIGKNNMKVLQRDCNIINCDATRFESYKDYNYFYLSNPFGKDTMRIVMKKIEDSYAENPRRITIIYYNPLCHEQIVESDFFKLRSTNKNMYRKITGRIFNIYSN